MTHSKYYLLNAECTTFLDDHIKANIVISEKPEQFLVRNIPLRELANKVSIHWYRTISKKSYMQLKKVNPPICGYFKLHKRDYYK